jgi:MoxR-like ATPase
MSNAVSLNIDELKGFLSHIIKTNKQLQIDGKNPISTEVVGESGIGKTSTMLQLAEEENLNYVKLNLAQIEELGDLVGYPIRQFQMAKNMAKEGEVAKWSMKWADEHLLEDYRNKGYKSTGKSQMGYCPPEWIADKKEGGILLLDDWNRADVRFIQAVMELVDRQEYISWKLPKNWHIILTANPDNGDYLVQSIDSAQKTRFVSVNLKFDAEVWAKWAESEDIDSRCINFLLLHPETVTQETNARSITTFFNAISSLDSFEDDLPLIQMIGEGSVGEEFSNLFTLFINNKLDKLVHPKVMLTHASDDHVVKLLREAIGIDNNYRADIASVLCTRFANYALYHAESNTINQPIIDRITKLTTDDVFGNDLKYYAVREILNGNKQKFQKLMMNPEVVKMATK